MNLTSLEELYNLFTVRAEKVITLIEEYGSIRGGLEHNSIILKLNESNSKKTKKITDEGISIKLQKEELISKKIRTARQIGTDNLYFISKLNFIQAQLKIDFKDDFQKKLNKLEGYFKEDQLTKQKEQNLFNLINEVIDDFYHYQNNVILRKRDEILNELN